MTGVDGANQHDTVLILPRHMTSWAELWPIARMLAARPGPQPVMVLATPQMAEKAPICAEAGVRSADLTLPLQAARRRATPIAGRAPERLNRWLEREPRLGASYLLGAWRRSVMARQLVAEREVFSDLIAGLRPKAVLMPGDRELSPVPPMLRAAADAGLPRIIAATSLPYIEGVAVPRAQSRAFRVLASEGAPRLNRVAARRFPKQVRETAYGGLLFSPGWRTLALADAGMLPENPWVQGGGLSTHMLQHSKDKLRSYLELGAPAEKMLMIGDLTLDPLYQTYLRRAELRTALLQQHGFDADAPLAVMAVPNEAEHDLCDWPTHLARQDSFWSRLAAERANVLLCLHPKSKRADYEALAGKCGFRFASQPLSETLPAADLFLCSCSTTAHWAKLCAVPTLNLDYLRLGMDYFNEPVGVGEVNTPAEFASALPRFLAYTRGPEMAALERQASAMREETLFDGRAGARFCVFLDELCAGAAPMRSRSVA